MAYSYCEFVRTLPADHPHTVYHDTEYGFPLRDDAALLERLSLEIAQAGLSWLTILKKQAGYRRAFDGFGLGTVAAYGDDDVARLLADPGIVRNRLKVNAVIEKALGSVWTNPASNGPAYDLGEKDAADDLRERIKDLRIGEPV